MTIIETPAAAAPGTDALYRALNGSVARIHLPGSPEYAELTATMHVIDVKRPALVVEARSAQDVVRTVRAARAHGTRVTVQSTGHSGPSDDMADAVLVATRGLDELTIDPAARTARVGAGVRWGAVNEAAAPHGLGSLCGSAPSVGVVGYLTGGGVGPLVRSHGLSSDRVLAFEVVTGDGELRRASDTENPDLFWGLRGGKGALGIVTAVEIELIDQREIYGGSLWFDEPDVPAALRTWAVWSELLPDEGTTSFAIMRMPVMEGVPPFLAGKTTLHVRFAWTGDPAVGEEMIRALRAVAAPLVDTVAVMPYSRIGEIHADPDEPMPAHTNHVLLERFGAPGAELLLGLAGPGTPTMQNVVEIRRVGGAMRDALHGPSAFAWREAEYMVFTAGVLVPEIAEPLLADARRLLAGLAPITAEGAYPNFAWGHGPQWVERVYPADVALRLRRISEHYDPAGVIDQSRQFRAL